MSDASRWNAFVDEAVERIRSVLYQEGKPVPAEEGLLVNVVELTLDYLLSSGYLLCRGGLPQKRI